MFIADQADMFCSLVLIAHNCPMIMVLNCLMFDDWDIAGVTCHYGDVDIGRCTKTRMFFPTV
jgi:hypothetical protein